MNNEPDDNETIEIEDEEDVENDRPEYDVDESIVDYLFAKYFGWLK